MSTTHAYRSGLPMTPLHHFPSVYEQHHERLVDNDRTLCSTPYLGSSFSYDTYLPKPIPTPLPSIHLNVNSGLTPPPTSQLNLPPIVKAELLTPPAQIIDVAPVSLNTVPPPQPQSQLLLPIMPSVKKDMSMAMKGTVAALPGIKTPVADHVAQLVMWFWFAQRPPATSPPTPPGLPTAADLATDQPFHALSVRAPEGFSSFVSRILHLTQVSHSVVLLSLLYVRRMARVFANPAVGSEKLFFTLALMLANKFLDDNTYTNRTWADLSKISIDILNSVELDALRNLGWDLAVNQIEFRTWTQLLDQLIFNHQNPHQQIHNQSQLAMSTPGLASTPSTLRPMRARTQSPPDHQFPRLPAAGQFVSPPRQRKRSACDAFSMEAAIAEQHAKAMRVPEKRGYVDLPGAPVSIDDRPTSGGASSLNRATSLNRAALRPPSVDIRRGSIPGMAPLVDPKSMLFTSHPSHPTTYTNCQYAAPVQDQYQLGPPPSPQGMLFYSLAADSHPGQDGHRRKATLHYQAPPPFYPHQFQAGGYSQPTNPSHYHIASMAELNPYTMFSNAAELSPMHQDPISHLAPIPGQYDGTQQFGHPAIPAPANFANAGPPGYQYEQEMHYRPNQSYAESQYYPSYQTHAPSQPGPYFHGQRRSIGSNAEVPTQSNNGAPTQTRSEWSSPMPGYPAYGW